MTDAHYSAPKAPLTGRSNQTPGLVKGLGWFEVIVSTLILIILTDVFIGSVFINKSADATLGIIMGAAVPLAVGFILVGWKLTQGAYWARTVILVVSFIRLVAFPLGTIWGAVAIYAFLANNDVKDFFADR